MTDNTFGSFFSGGGLADVGAMAAGYTPVFACECDPGNYKQSMAIADCYELNIGKHVIRKPVQELIVSELPRVDWFHASPVCKNFSNAKLDSKESDIDIVTAQAVVDYIDYHKPRLVTIENVRDYKHSQAWRNIASCLTRNGYGFTVAIINSADYGVPQTRVRMIVRAVLNGSPPLLTPTHSKNPRPMLFAPTPEKWVGWYESVQDIAHTFPDSEFADWQKIRLKEAGWLFEDNTLVSGASTCDTRTNEPALTVVSSAHNLSGLRAVIKEDSFLMNAANPNGNETRKWRMGIEPAKTVTASDSANIRGYLAEGMAGGDRPLQLREHTRPSMTVTTATGGNDYKMFLAGVHRAYIGRVVRITTQGLARFMSLPDWYNLPEHKGTACTLLGNGVPSLLMQRVGETWE